MEIRMYKQWKERKPENSKEKPRRKKRRLAIVTADSMIKISNFGKLAQKFTTVICESVLLWR